VPPLLRLGLQYGRFGTVGAAATVAHVVMFIALVELAGLVPLAANFVAFCVAVGISFFGHFHWTFREQTRIGGEHRQGIALVRFIAVALTGLALNSGVVYVVVNLLEVPYPFAIAVVIVIVPLFIFGLTKMWAFAPIVKTEASGR
jgi:putative flippase GtrA